MADYRTRENVEPALAALEKAAGDDVRWQALAQVLRVQLGLLIEIVGYSKLPIADLEKADDE